ncbi:adenosine receptor A3 [Anabrus simplex]|uniref:adenosine receptor A3 n=1 Tax=Anabrus simplex TaxID=316456 RepID=UPI0035A2FE20
MANQEAPGSSEEDRILPVVFILLDVCIIIGNAFILFVVIKNWKTIRLQRKNRAAHLLTVNLCSADLLLAAIDIYYMLALYVPDLAAYLIHHKIPCLITLTSYITAHMASGFTLVAIAVERYIYIVHGIRYSKIMDSGRILLMLSIVWLAAIFGTLPLYIWNNWDKSEGLCHAVNIIPRTYSMIATVGRILFIIIAITILHCRIHRKALQIHERRGPLRAMAVLRTKSARVVLIITIAYVISWLPYLVVFSCKRFDVDVPPLLFKFAECLITLNYLVNPFIYAFHNRPIQHAIMKTLKSCKNMHDENEMKSRENENSFKGVSCTSSSRNFSPTSSRHISKTEPGESKG